MRPGAHDAVTEPSGVGAPAADPADAAATGTDGRPLVWFRGQVVPEDRALIPISSEIALRGASVFEGVRAYVTVDGGLGFLALREHLDRLMTSAVLLGIAHPYTVTGLTSAIRSLLREQHHCAARDLYVRPSIGVESGRLPTDGNYRTLDHVAAVPSPRNDLWQPATAVVSRWRRPADGSLPSQVKAGGAYLSFRLPLLERHRAGADAVIMLNETGMVAEADGAAVCLVRSGTVLAPPSRDGGLRSITRQIALDAARELGIETQEVPIRHGELYEADGVFLTGTLCELMPVAVLDGVPVDTLSCAVYRDLATRFERMRRGEARVGGWSLEPADDLLAGPTYAG